MKNQMNHFNKFLHSIHRTHFNYLLNLRVIKKNKIHRFTRAVIFIILFSFSIQLSAVDQKMEQITGSDSDDQKEFNSKDNKSIQDPDLKKMKEELEFLKKEIELMKVENKKNKPSNIENKDKDTPPQNLFGGIEVTAKANPVESQERYGGFSRDLFMQVQTPDFKKKLAERYQWQVLFWTHGNYSNNSDLRKIDSTNQTSINFTDDRTQFVAGGVQFDNFFPVNPRLDFRFDIWRFGFWGQDQLAGRDTNNDIKTTSSGANTLNFGQLYIDWHFKLEPTRTDRFSLRVGRQDFRIGGRIHRDFYQDDILDAVVLKWYNPRWGKLDLLLLDVFSNGPDTKDVNFIRFLSLSSPTVNNFNGKTTTLRHGIKYRYSFFGDSDLIGDHLEFTPFYYIAHYSGTNQPFGGADRSFQGTSGNFIDNDFVIMRGARINYGFSKWFRTATTYAESYGIDRKVPTLLLENRDVDTNGKSYHIELEFSAFKRRVKFLPSYFISDGGRYYLDGTQYSHGFTSFKGDQVGGLLTDLYWGIHPSSYTSHQGTVDQPYNQDRKTGTQFKHIGLAFGVLENLFLKLDYWRLEDTNQFSFLGTRPHGSPNFMLRGNRPMDPDIQTILFDQAAKFYPDNSAVIMAARRFGTPMGEEYNVGMDWNLFRGFKVWATWGVLIPMRYYSTQGLIQGAPQGNARFVAFQLGTSLIF
jgi:hypothetical protein